MQKNDSSAFFAYLLGSFVGFCKGFIVGIVFIKFIYPKLIDLYDDYMNNEEFLFDEDDFIEKEVFTQQNSEENVEVPEASESDDDFEQDLEETV